MVCFTVDDEVNGLEVLMLFFNTHFRQENALEGNPVIWATWNRKDDSGEDHRREDAVILHQLFRGDQRDQGYPEHHETGG